MLKLIRIILSPLTILYKVIINLRNSFFDKDIFKQTKVNCKIISIGNLTVGGSGKTPFVIMLTKYLKGKNSKVGVLSRGYGRSSKGYKLVSTDGINLIDVNESGDEIYLVSSECKVPAAVSEKRVDGANKFLNDVKKKQKSLGEITEVEEDIKKIVSKGKSRKTKKKSSRKKKK